MYLPYSCTYFTQIYQCTDVIFVRVSWVPSSTNQNWKSKFPASMCQVNQPVCRLTVNNDFIVPEEPLRLIIGLQNLCRQFCCSFVFQWQSLNLFIITRLNAECLMVTQTCAVIHAFRFFHNMFASRKPPEKQQWAPLCPLSQTCKAEVKLATCKRD